MLERFQGKDGRPALMDALRRQFLVDGSSGIADMIASAMQLKEYHQGEALFEQGDRGGDLFFILVGKVSIHVDQREVAIVEGGLHVGEIGMLEPFKGRSASVVAVDTVVAARITQARFFEIAREHPDLFRRMALELGHRLVDTQRRG
jgi:CRP-like cAMP-binding protein